MKGTTAPPLNQSRYIGFRFIITRPRFIYTAFSFFLWTRRRRTRTRDEAAETRISRMTTVKPGTVEEADIDNFSETTVLSNASRKNKVKYYAVRTGFKPGIYHTYSDCLNQIRGFKNPMCTLSLSWLLPLYLSCSLHSSSRLLPLFRPLLTAHPLTPHSQDLLRPRRSKSIPRRPIDDLNRNRRNSNQILRRPKRPNPGRLHRLAVCPTTDHRLDKAPSQSIRVARGGRGVCQRRSRTDRHHKHGWLRRLDWNEARKRFNRRRPVIEEGEEH